jgi:MoxR-like ATPase
VTVPEIGTILATTRPIVFLTSNNTREMSEALKRRCLHLFIPFPDPKLEREIIRVKVPDLSEVLNFKLVSFIQQVRKMDLKKRPSISETLDWARVLVMLHASSLSADLIRDTLSVFLKFEEDIQMVRERIQDLVAKDIRGAIG